MVAAWHLNWPKTKRISMYLKKILGLQAGRTNHRAIQVFCMRVYTMSRIFVRSKADCVSRATACGLNLHENINYLANKLEN